MTITWTGTNKSSSSWTPVTKSTSSWTSTNKSTAQAPAGQYYGFGAFTYSGGQTLVGTTSWTAVTKS